MLDSATRVLEDTVRPPAAAALSPAPPVRRRRWLLGAVLVASVGLLVQCVGYAVGWQVSAGREPRVLGVPAERLTAWTFYVGLVMVCLPFVLLLTARSITRRERVWGAVAYTHLMYLSWWSLSPLLGLHFDENLRVTNEVALLSGDRLVTPNPMLPVSPYFPGLELVSTSLHWLTGLPLAACHVLTVVLARSILVLCLYALVQRLTRSDLAASVAVVLYAANPQFYFFDAQFNYDTLAVALATLVLWSVARMQRLERRDLAVAKLTVVLALAALTVTHHLGDWITCLVLWVWAGLHLAAKESVRARSVAHVAVIATLLAVAWAALAGSLLEEYLGPLFGRSWQQLVSLLDGQGGGRELFQDHAGTATPPWQKLLLLVSSALWAAMLVPPAWLVLRRRLLDHGVVRLLPWAVGCLYPLLLVVRVSPNAAEVSVRAAAYVTLASSLLVAAWLASGPLTRWWAGPARRRQRTALIAVVGTVLTVGGVVLGAGPNWEHQNGRYLPAAQHRAVDRDSLAVVRWAQRHLPVGSRVAADTTFSRLMPNYADVVPVTYLGGSVNVAGIFLTDTVGEEAAGLIADGAVDFVVADTRFVDRVSPNGSLFEPSDRWDSHGSTMTAQQVDKFDRAPGFDLVLDAGGVRVYDVRSLRGEPQTFADRSATWLPGTWSPSRSILTGVLITAAVVVAAAVVRRRQRRLRVPVDASPVAAVATGTLMLISVLGHALGYSPLIGTVVLAGVVMGLTVWLLRVSVPAPDPAPRPRWQRAQGTGVLPMAAAGVLLVGLSIGVAAWGQWHGLVGAADVLPPPAVSATGGED